MAKGTNTLHEDLYAFPPGGWPWTVKYPVGAVVFQTKVIGENETHLMSCIILQTFYGFWDSERENGVFSFPKLKYILKS
jgi:hypothetical protein